MALFTAFIIIIIIALWCKHTKGLLVTCTNSRESTLHYLFTYLLTYLYTHIHTDSTSSSGLRWVDVTGGILSKDRDSVMSNCCYLQS